VLDGAHVAPIDSGGLMWRLRLAWMLIMLMSGIQKVGPDGDAQAKSSQASALYVSVL
jgi:hypothetical protein